MLTDDAVKLIREMADCTTKGEWERLMAQNSEKGSHIGGVMSTCTDKLLVIALTRDTARSLAQEILDLRARVAAVKQEVE